jgi:hypothetical protein
MFMKCSYHPAGDAAQLCRTCNKPLCAECAHQIKGKHYCQDCLVQGAEWVATFKELRIPADAPKRAALLSLIPGMGAVYNNQYIKALTFFAVFALLAIMGDEVHGIFGFGAVVFLVFTLFDSYRTAEQNLRFRLEPASAAKPVVSDRMTFGWGLFLILLGVLFLLQNIIPFHFLSRLWPLMFILLGAYLVFRFVRDRQEMEKVPAPPSTESGGK